MSTAVQIVPISKESLKELYKQGESKVPEVPEEEEEEEEEDYSEEDDHWNVDGIYRCENVNEHRKRFVPLPGGVDYDWGSLRIHYGYCVYCIFDGIKWDQEWDSWSEVAERAGGLIKTGFQDCVDGIDKYPQPEKKTRSKKELKMGYPHPSVTKTAWQMYSDGYDMATSLKK